MKMLPLRFPESLEPRIERLVEKVAQDADFQAARISVSFVLRMAIYAGLEALERRYGVES
jgi:hypothetical protein